MSPIYAPKQFFSAPDLRVKLRALSEPLISLGLNTMSHLPLSTFCSTSQCPWGVRLTRSTRYTAASPSALAACTAANNTQTCRARVSRDLSIHTVANKSVTSCWQQVVVMEFGKRHDTTNTQRSFARANLLLTC